MIDISALRRLADGDRHHVDVDHRGVLADLGELDAEGPAILIAVPVTDAVKVVAEGVVLGSFDKDALWSIQGFRLGSEVILELDDSVSDPQSLIDAVTEAGFQWRVVNPTTGVL